MEKTENNIDISVIVPIYNVEEYLEECLDSLLNQTKENIEIIMVDDGSTDRSGEIADAYAEKYPHFHCYHKANGGLGHARNYGVPHAKGKYIAFVDSDDVVSLDMYDKMFAYAERNGSDLTICNVVRFNTKKVWASNLHRLAFHNMRTNTHITKNQNLIYDTTSWNKLILRSFYLQHNFAFPENILYEDIPVTIPMHYLANNVSIVENTYYFWRVRDGVSKSITQNYDKTRNLTDRIKILEMLDDFFEKNVKEPALHQMKQKKALEVDLMIFLNKFDYMSHEVVEEMLMAINEYIDKAIDKDSFQRIRLIYRQKYEYMRNYDIDNLIKLTEYQRNGYYNAQVREEDGKFQITVDDSLFTLKDRDITDEIIQIEPKRYIDRVEIKEGKIHIYAYVYKHRLNIEDASGQSIQAFLENEYTAERISLPVTPVEDGKATQSRGTLFDVATGITSKYNYDGAGFEIELDLDKFDLTRKDEGFYKIFIVYENRVSAGSFYLDSIYKRKIGHAVVLEDKYAQIDYDPSGEIRLFLKGGNSFVQDMAVEGANIAIFLEKKAEKVWARREEQTDESPLYFKTEDGQAFLAPLSDFARDVNYSLFVKEEDGSEGPLFCRNKRVSIKNEEGPAVIFVTGMSHQVRFATRDAITLLNKMQETEEGVVKLRTAVLTDGTDFARAQRAVLYVEDVITGGQTVLARSKCTHKDGKAYCKFSVNFDDEKITRNLYASTRDVFVAYKDADRELGASLLYSRKFYRIEKKFPTLELVCYRSGGGNIRLRSSKLWPQEEDTYQKRQALTARNYPQYRTEKLDNRCIVFESMWGRKYSCNPQHLYEYVDAHYPMYKCVWSLNDERMPIKGNGIRVRRGSQEYYHYLATAKYFVNNVNFETGYVKREGQIEIQTMHGTPLKTLGLDVETDFPNEKSRIRYIEKNSRWDYLLVQGRFMKEKAYDCFQFEKEILECGYPRTDILFNTDKDKILDIKKDLGLPLDKKIILYAPTWRMKGTFDMRLDLEKLREAFGEQYIVLVRLHHLCAPEDWIEADNQFVFDLHAYKCVEDLYLISDMLITDYSSVMFDYALLDRPMIFYMYDLAEYRDNLRGLYVDIEQEAPGPIVFDTEGVIQAVKNIEGEMQKCSGKIAAFKEKYLGYESGVSCEAIVKKVFRPSKIANAFSQLKRKILK